MSLKKVFGIISYFPNSDTPYHTETRTKRTKRFFSMLYRLEELWPTVDIIIIAQNWQGLAIPDIHNRVTIYNYPKLGILNARKELRKKFLESEYDYLIMMDDDAIIEYADSERYLKEIDDHPNGVGVIRHNKCPLMFCAVSKSIYSQQDMVDIDAENGQGFEDDIFVATVFNKFPDKAFDFSPNVIKEISFRYDGELGAVPSTWSREKKLSWNYMRSNTLDIINRLNGGI
jgi:hypothetical protein